MEERLTAREIGSYIELRKKIAEDEYKYNYIKSTAGDHSQLLGEMDREIRENKAKMKIIEGKIEHRGLQLVVPFQNRIEKLAEAVSKAPPEEVSKAMKEKTGELYSCMSERGKIIRKHIEAKNEIGKLNVLAHQSSTELKACIHETLKNGEPAERPAELGDERGSRIVRLLNRVGIRCNFYEGKLVKMGDDWPESRVLVNSDYFWVPSEKLGAFTENEKMLAEVSVRLQVKNAELQVITFNEQQQNDFKNLQTHYMELLRSRKEMIGLEEKELELSI